MTTRTRPVKEDATPEMGFRFFAAREQNAHREIQMSASEMLDEFLVEVAELVMKKYEIEFEDSLDIVLIALDELAEEGVVPEYPEDGAGEEEFKAYYETVSKNAGVMERIDQIGADAVSDEGEEYEEE